MYLGWQALPLGRPVARDRIGHPSFVPVNGAAAAAAGPGGVDAIAGGSGHAACLAVVVRGSDLATCWVTLAQNVLRAGPAHGPALPEAQPDAGYLAFYPMALLGLLRLPTPRRSREQRLTLAFDLGTVVLGGTAAHLDCPTGPTVWPPALRTLSRC